MQRALVLVFVGPDNQVTIGRNGCSRRKLPLDEVCGVVGQVKTAEVNRGCVVVVQFNPVFQFGGFVCGAGGIAGEDFIDDHAVRSLLGCNGVYENVVFGTGRQVRSRQGRIVGDGFDVIPYESSRGITRNRRAVNAICSCAVIVRAVIEHLRDGEIPDQSGGVIQIYLVDAIGGSHSGFDIGHFVSQRDSFRHHAIVKRCRCDDRCNLRHFGVGHQVIPAVGHNGLELRNAAGVLCRRVQFLRVGGDERGDLCVHFIDDRICVCRRKGFVQNGAVVREVALAPFRDVEQFVEQRIVHARGILEWCP